MLITRDKIRLLRLYNKLSDLLSEVYNNYGVATFKRESENPVCGIIMREVKTFRGFNEQGLLIELSDNMHWYIGYDARTIYDKSVFFQEAIERDNYSLQPSKVNLDILKNMEYYIGQFELFYEDVQKYPKVT